MRHPRWLLVVPPLLLSLAACDPPGDGVPDTSADDGPPRRGGSVTIVELGDISKPMPLISETSLDNEITSTLYLSMLAPRWEDGELLYLTAEEDNTALARSYEFFGPDSASLRYRMRSDVRWSDGRPVTAHDAAWTLETQGNPSTASPRMAYNEQIRSIDVEDDTTLVIHFTRRYPEVFFHTAGNVAPRHLYEDTDPAQLRNHPAVNNPGGGALVVSGPYMIGEWLRGQRLVLVPNPEFQPQPYIERVVFLPITEETTRMVEFQTGNVDVLYPVPFDKIELIRQSVQDARFEARRRRFYDYISYNPLAHPAFEDAEIRRALGLAIDIDGLIAALQLGEYAEAAGGPYSPIFKLLYDPEAHAPLPYDPDEAARILDEKGWAPGPDGIRVRDGRPLRFTLSTNAGNQRRADIAQIVQQQWRRIGVDVNIQTLESNTFFDRLSDKDYEASIAGWGVGLAPDLSGLWTGDGPFNQTSFDHPEVNRLIEVALSQPTEEAAAEYWREAAGYIVAEQPYTWLFYFDQLVAVKNRVRNTRIDTLGTYQNLHEWWVTDGDEDAGGGAATSEGSSGGPGAPAGDGGGAGGAGSGDTSGDTAAGDTAGGA
jgi:peptide/nickel transport system substrate-binding protein